MELKTKFNIGDRVRIKELTRNGLIRAIHVTNGDLQYLVRYFDNAEAKEVYFLENEIENT